MPGSAPPKDSLHLRPGGSCTCASSPLDGSGVPASISGLLAAPTGKRPLSISSVGSVGHPHFCHNACRFVQKGECERGSACDFCHRCSYKASFKLDAESKKTLRRMDSDSLDVLLATVVRDKLDEISVSPSGTSFVEQWRWTFEMALPEAKLRMLKLPGIAPSSIRRLLSGLHNMNIHGLCGIARTAQEHSVVADATESLLRSLRKSENNAEL